MLKTKANECQRIHYKIKKDFRFQILFFFSPEYEFQSTHTFNLPITSSNLIMWWGNCYFNRMDQIQKCILSKSKTTNKCIQISWQSCKNRIQWASDTQQRVRKVLSPLEIAKTSIPQTLIKTNIWSCLTFSKRLNFLKFWIARLLELLVHLVMHVHRPEV